MSTTEHPNAIQPEAWEFPIMLSLINTIEPNSKPEHLVPDPNKAYRRYPEPKIWSQGDLSNPNTAIECRMQLYFAWDMSLIILEDAMLYDGSTESAEAFQLATGLTPERFAQGWMEAEGCFWRFFYPSKTGGDVVKALLNVWAVKTQKWREIGREAAMKATRDRYSPWNDFNVMERFTKREFGKIIAPGEHRAGERQLWIALKSTAVFDCDAHPARELCNCPVAMDMPIIHNINTRRGFVDAWETFLMGNDDAFLYTGDIASATLFKVRSGKTVVDFAKDFMSMTMQSVPGVWTWTTTEAEFLKGMLAFWTEHVTRWRRQFNTRRETRTAIQENFRDQVQMVKVDATTGIGRPLGPREDIGEGDDLVRVVDVGPLGHQYTFVMYPKMKDGIFRWNILRFIMCHERKECQRDIPRSELDAALEPFRKEDKIKAQNVRSEW